MTGDARPDLEDRLGYLLKHAHARFLAESARALEPLGTDGRELATLSVLIAAPVSQLEAATALGVDRTTMVALIDALEAKGLVTRRRSPQDRRKNIVQLTDDGQALHTAAEAARREAERRFLAPLAPADADALRHMLRALLTEPS